jgi:hypothetical protein
MVRWSRVVGTLVTVAAGLVGAAAWTAQAVLPAAALADERALAATISEARMVEAVRRLVTFGHRMYGTPSNHASAAWLAGAFREAGLQVQVREDTARDWYQPISWEVRIEGPDGAGIVLQTAWPSLGSPSSKGEGRLALGPEPGAICLFPQSLPAETGRAQAAAGGGQVQTRPLGANPTPEAVAGCAAVLFDGRPSPSGWPAVGRLRGAWAIPVFAIAPREAATLRDRLAAREPIRAKFTLEARSGKDAAHTVVATLPGKDHSRHILFCAHGDADSGGPGADDNASGVAVVLEIARALSEAVRSGRIPQPAWDLRFVVWGGEIASTQQYVAAMGQDGARLEAVINYDQSGFGSAKNALYVEPDDVAANRALITLVRAVMRDHLGSRGFPERAATVRSQGGTDSYVFQPKAEGATVYPAVTLFTSAWDRERAQPVTEGFPPLNWYPDDKPGMVTVDGDAFYHSTGDTPANTTDTEPFNMGWCARVGLLTALRWMGR